jgi:hypothetical protein
MSDRWLTAMSKIGRCWSQKYNVKELYWISLAQNSVSLIILLLQEPLLMCVLGKSMESIPKEVQQKNLENDIDTFQSSQQVIKKKTFSCFVINNFTGL